VLLARLEAGRQIYNACLGEALKRLTLYKQSKLYQQARKLPKGKLRNETFNQARQALGYTEYALQSYANQLRHGGGGWLGKNLDSHTTQKLGTRAFKAVEKVNFYQAKRVRFKGKNQLDSLEGKSNSAGIRWRSETLCWSDLKLASKIESHDPVILHGLNSPIKYVRLVRRKRGGKNYFYAQLINLGIPFQKSKHQVGEGTVGLDLGPSTIAIVGEDQATLKPFCPGIADKSRQIRRLQRQLERQRRANNPNNYEPDFKDAKGRKKKGKIKKGQKTWPNSRSYLKTRQQKSEIERKLAAHRTSLQNCLAHEVFSYGHIVKLEKLSYKAFQRLFGKSVARNAPAKFVERLRQIAEKANHTVVYEFPTYKTKLSQRCLCGSIKKKSLSCRVHQCECGIVQQRDLFSAFLARFIDLETATFQAAEAEKAYCPSLDTVLRGAWEAAQSQYNQSSIGKASLSQRSLRNGEASEKIPQEALECQIKNQDVVASRVIGPNSESLVEI
jgi:transposase